jgi:hypothetical protein
MSDASTAVPRPARFSLLARLSPAQYNLLIGFVQLFLLTTNIRNFAQGRLGWGVAFCFINTYMIRAGYRAAHHSNRREYFVYAVGCCFGVIAGVLFQHYIVTQFPIFQIAAAALGLSSNHGLNGHI